MILPYRLALFASAIAIAAPALAQAPATDAGALRSELNAARERINDLERRLQALESRGAAPGAGPTAALPGEAPSGSAAGIERVGEAPPEFDRTPQIAVLGDQGAVITRPGELTAEIGLDYTRA